MLIDDVRVMVSAGTAEYTAVGETWWTDEQLQDVLDRHRVYVGGAALVFTPEPVVGGGGSLAYTRALVNLGLAVEPGPATAGVAADWKIMTPGGVVPSGGLELERDGVVTFVSDQASVSSSLEFFGYAYDLPAAAAECLDAWASHVKTAYDFKTDDQEFDRSQVYANLTDRARELRRQSPPRVAQLAVPDDNPAVRRTGAMTANQRRTLGL